LANSGLYEGNALQGVDAKGRVAIPAQFRSVIERNAEGPDARTIVVGKHPDLPCLRAYDTSWSQLNHERIDGREVAAEDASEFQRQKERSFGNVDRAVFDPAGRFVLHGLLKRKAKIDDLAFFTGAGRTFNIWSPTVLLASADADEETREWCEYYLELRGAKA
jgi:MraZ protein